MSYSLYIVVSLLVLIHRRRSNVYESSVVSVWCLACDVELSRRLHSQTCHDPVFGIECNTSTLRFLGLQYPPARAHNTVCNTSPLPFLYRLQYLPPYQAKISCEYDLKYIFLSVQNRKFGKFSSEAAPLLGVMLSDEKPPTVRCAGA